MKKLFLIQTLSILFILNGISQDLPSYVPTDGLVGYYPFNGNANDSSGNGNNGTVSGATLTADKDGDENNAYSFDGDQDQITIANNDVINAAQMTISAWIKASRYTALEQDQGDHQQVIVSNAHQDGWGSGFEFKTNGRTDNNGSQYLSLGVTGTINGNFNSETDNIGLSLNEWNHVIYTHDNDNIKFYLNGELVFTENSPGTNFYNNNSISIGSRPSIRHVFSGGIDDVGIWNKVLSADEIANLFSGSADILLNGTVSAENNQIKNLADPTDAQDAVTKTYLDNNVNSFSGSYNDLTDTPTMYTHAQVDELISNLQSQYDGLPIPRGTAAINHNNKAYSGVACDGYWLGFKFSVSESQTITALGAWDEGHNVEVNDEFGSCPDASNFSVPIAIYKNDVLVLEKVINASTGLVIGNSRYIKIDDFVLTPGDEYFVVGNYEGSSKFGYFNSNLVTTDYDSRITPLTVTSSPIFSKSTNGDGTFPSNLTTLSNNQWSDQYFHVNFLIKD